jgi:L-fuconolactonase
MSEEFIDRHHHFWKYSATEYPWISGEMGAIRRDFSLGDLQLVAQGTAVTGTGRGSG